MEVSSYRLRIVSVALCASQEAEQFLELDNVFRTLCPDLQQVSNSRACDLHLLPHSAARPVDND